MLEQVGQELHQQLQVRLLLAAVAAVAVHTTLVARLVQPATVVVLAVQAVDLMLATPEQQTQAAAVAALQ
jgi:hypothetical protein